MLADVQRQLAAGWSDGDILAALTAKGLSRVSAERFLQRARPAGSAPPPLPVAPPPVPMAPPPPLPAADPYAAASFAEIAPPPPPDAATVVFTAPPPAEAATVLYEAPPLPADTPTVVFEAPPMPIDGPPPIPLHAPPPVPAAVASPRRFEPPPPPSSNTSDGPGTASWLGVIGGSLVMTLGLIFLAWALGQERVRIRLPLALTFGGAAWLFSSARGLVDLRRPATWVLPGTAAAPPALAALAVIGALLTTGTPRPPREVTDGVAAVPEDRAPLARRPRATREGTIAAEVERLQGTRAGDPCQAANMLAELGAQDQVPLLQHFFDEAATDDRKVCAAHALTRLGEGPAMLPHYLEWSRSDSDTLVHHAIVGFGHIGPSAAHEAVPVLQEILTDNASAARRWVIVSTLAKLGPTAAPALQLVVDDEDAQVRTAAQKALEKLR